MGGNGATNSLWLQNGIFVAGGAALSSFASAVNFTAAITATTITNTTISGTTGTWSGTVSVASTATTTAQNVSSKNAFVSNSGLIAADGSGTNRYNCTVAAAGSGVYNITFPWTLATDAKIIAWCYDSNHTLAITSGGGGNPTLQLTTSDVTNHAFAFFVFGG